jgi:hypothetical protein
MNCLVEPIESALTVFDKEAAAGDAVAGMNAFVNSITCPHSWVSNISGT